MSDQKRTALITGITGQDGSYLAEFLLSKDYEVYGLVRRTSTPTIGRIQHILDRVTLLQGDLLDQGSLQKAIEQSQPDEIYNLAAMSFVGTSFSQPLAVAEYNALGPVRLMEAAKTAGHKGIKFYQASTSEMFGCHEEPCTERTAMHPCSPYGTAKLYAHHMVTNYRDRGLFAVSGILFNHESPRRGKEFVTSKIVNTVKRIANKQEKHIVLGNVQAYRDWGYAPEYVRAMWLMLQQEQPDDFVIATGYQMTVLEFYQTACHIADIDWQEHLVISEEYIRPTDIHYLIGDASKARWVLGWKPMYHGIDLIEKLMKGEETHDEN